MMSNENPKKRRILLIDDEPGLVEIIEDVLGGGAYDLTATTDSTNAMELIQNQHFDLVITDLQMPVVDGIKITETVAAQDGDTDVIVVTGYGSLETAITALKHDVYDYILKPFNVMDIESTVERVFKKRELEEQNALLQGQVADNLNQLTTLYEIARFINSSENMQEVVQFATDTLASSIGLERFCLIMDEENSGQFHVRSGAGLEDESRQQLKLAIGEGPVGKAIADGEITFVDDYRDDSIFCEGLVESDLQAIQGVLVVPLRAETDKFGALLLFDFAERTTENQQQLEWVSVLTIQIAPIIKLFLQKDAFEKVSRDPLIAVKRQMTSIIDRAAAFRGGMVFTVFKLYMKKTGGMPPNIVETHDRIFKLLSEKVSSIDAVIVLGVDSFVVILQGYTRAKAEMFGSAAKREVESLLSSENDGPFLLDYGSSVYPFDGTNAEELISIAQQNIWKQVKKS
jgi:CheY-like chemotaxis protein